MNSLTTIILTVMNSALSLTITVAMPAICKKIMNTDKSLINSSIIIEEKQNLSNQSDIKTENQDQGETPTKESEHQHEGPMRRIPSSSVFGRSVTESTDLNIENIRRNLRKVNDTNGPRPLRTTPQAGDNSGINITQFMKDRRKAMGLNSTSSSDNSSSDESSSSENYW